MSKGLLSDVLHRVPDLIIEIDGSNNITTHYEGRTFTFGSEALGLLDAFGEDCRIDEALRRLAPRLVGRHAIKDVLACLIQMREAGILTDESRESFSDLTFPRGGYDAAYIHIRMLNDTVRKQAFLKAIQEVVSPNDVVLDLGTGSGILAVAAARAGARHVYALEPSSVIRIAKQVAQVNGVADRITFIRGWSSRIELPERATVLTTDIIGNESLEMRIWEVLADARERLLTEDARLIPASIATKVFLTEAPTELLRQYRADTDHVKAWELAYGIDFSPFVHARGEAQHGRFYIEPHHAAEWPALSQPVTAYEVDLTTEPRSFVTEKELVVDHAGTGTALVAFLEARLSQSVTLSTAPWNGNKASHWYCVCSAFAAPMSVATGDRLPFRYSYQGDGRSVLQPL